MKITNIKLVNVANILDKYTKKKLPQKISYAITKNLMRISSEYGVYEAQLKKLFSEFDDHIKKDENGNMKMNDKGVPIVDSSVADKFYKELSDLLHIEIDIDLYQIDPDVFDYDDNGNYDPLSAEDIISLQSIICKQERKTEKKD